MTIYVYRIASSAESVGKYRFRQITKGYDTWLFAGNLVIYNHKLFP